MGDNKNIDAKRLHEQLDDVLKELSLPAHYVEYLKTGPLRWLEEKQSSNKKAIDEKRNQLLQLHKKIDNIQEDRNNRVLDANSYSKWFTRYSLEKSTIESDLDNMSKPADSVIKKYEATCRY